MSLRPDPARIIVPRRHGEVLIEPPLKQLESALRAPSPPPPRGGSHVPSPFEAPLEQLKAAARHHLVEAATQWANQIGAEPPPPDAAARPILLTGHQVEFYHPGVWAKVLVADELAKRTNATAFDLLVDHDTVDHLGFSVPVQNATGEWSKTRIDFAPPSPLPADALDAPTVDQFEHWDSELADHPATHTDTMAYWLAALRPKTQHSAPRTQHYTPWLSSARRQFEASLGIHVHHVPTSLLCTGPLWQQFVHAWIENAEAWTAAYNRHLTDYRREQNIKNPNRPMPNLTTSTSGNTKTYELPFWIYTPNTPRQRLTIQIKNGAPTIFLEGKALDPDFVIRASSFVIRPRALTLTLFARLFFADLFLHGIGGTLYDQITDRLLLELFHTVPSYACVSAAWLLPLGQPVDPEDIAALRHRRHHIEHNPQLAIDPFTALKTDVAERITARKHVINEITTSLQTARRNREEKARRRQLFKQLHALNAELHAFSPRILKNLDHQLITATHAAAQNTVLQNREFFLALHTTQSLQKLITFLRQ